LDDIFENLCGQDNIELFSRNHQWSLPKSLLHLTTDFKLAKLRGFYRKETSLGHPMLDSVERFVES
jgi:hypothetical protein